MPSTISKQKKKDPFKEHTNKSKLSDKVKKKTDRTRKDAPANDARINPPKNKTLKELEADLAAKHKKQKKAQEDSLNKTKIQPGEKTGKEKKAEQARKDKEAEDAAFGGAIGSVLLGGLGGAIGGPVGASLGSSLGGALGSSL